AARHCHRLDNQPGPVPVPIRAHPDSPTRRRRAKIHSAARPAARHATTVNARPTRRPADCRRPARFLPEPAMRLTAMTDFSMRLLMYLGSHPDRLCTIAEIARVHGVSEPHLMQITHRLAPAGRVVTVGWENGRRPLGNASGDIQ